MWLTSLGGTRLAKKLIRFRVALAERGTYSFGKVRVDPAKLGPLLISGVSTFLQAAWGDARA